MSYREAPAPSLLFVSFGRSVRALDPRTGEERWCNTDGGDAAGGALVHAGGRVYSGGWRQLLALDATTGKTLWRCSVNVPGRFALVLRGDALFAAGGGSVACVGLDGVVRWQRKLPDSGISLALAIDELAARDDREG